MTFSDDYKDAIFWDPKTGEKYVLKNRVEDTTKLKNFLEGKYYDYEGCKNNILTKPIDKTEDTDPNKDKKQKRRDFDDKKIPGTGDEDSILAFQNDEFADNVINDEENMNNNLEKIAMFGDKGGQGNNPQDAIKFKYNKKFYDDFAFAKVSEGGYTNYNYKFNEEQKQEMDKKLRSNGEQFLLPIEDFKDDMGHILMNVNMPFETLDLIFNRRNIWANCQFHDPCHIRFNIYDEDCWYPFINLKNGKIWNDKFEPFFSLANFSSQLSPNQVLRMRETLIREVRIGVTAARSGMNLQTKFKKKNEQINGILAKYLDYLEEKALNRIDESVFKLKFEEWEDMIKTRLPKFYKMEAKTIFFNYFDLEGIRREINDDLEHFYKSKTKNLMFATAAKIFPYLNQVVSVRIILAKFYRIPEEDIGKEDILAYKEEFSNVKKELEEEKDDEDDINDTPEEKKRRRH